MVQAMDHGASDRSVSTPRSGDVGRCDDDVDALPPGTADDDDELVGDIRVWMLASGQRRLRRDSLMRTSCAFAAASCC